MKLLNDGVMRVAVASIAIIMAVGILVCYYILLSGGVIWS